MSTQGVWGARHGVAGVGGIVGMRSDLKRVEMSCYLRQEKAGEAALEA